MPPWLLPRDSRLGKTRSIVTVCPDPAILGIGFDEVAFRSVLRADVLRLHALASGSKEGGDAASLRSTSPGLEDATRGGIAALLELLLAKCMEAVLCCLEDTADLGNGAKHAENVFSPGSSLVRPLEVALGRLRQLHERTRHAAPRPAVSRTSAMSALPIKQVLPRVSQEVQTEEPSLFSIQAVAPGGVAAALSAQASLELPPAAVAPTSGLEVHMQRRRGKLKSCGVQAGSCGQARSMGTQAEAKDLELLPTPSQFLRDMRDACVQTQTLEMRSMEIGTKTPDMQSTSTQTDDCTPVGSMAPTAVMSGASSTVRVLRMTRMQRASASLPSLRHEVEASASSILPRKEAVVILRPASHRKNSEVVQHRGACGERREYDRPVSNCSVASGSESFTDVISKPSSAATSVATSTTAGPTSVASCSNSALHSAAPRQKERSLRSIRCVAGHAMQWVWLRGRRSEHGIDGCSSFCAPHCSLCGMAIGDASGFHFCSVCSHNTGERHSVCGTCAKEAQAVVGQALLPSRSSGMGVHKSASTGSIPLPRRPGPRDSLARAAEWAMVSSLLPSVSAVATEDVLAACAAHSVTKRPLVTLDRC